MLHQRLGIFAVRESGTSQEFTETAHLDDHFPTAELADFVSFLIGHLQPLAFHGNFCIGQFLAETFVEFAQQSFPVLLTLFHGIQSGLHVGGKFHIDNIIEPLHHQSGNHFTQSRGHQALVLLDDVIPVLNDRNGGCIGRRTANTLFFHGLDQGCLGISGRRLGEVLFFVKLGSGSLVAHSQLRQSSADSFRFLVPALFVDGDEAGETERGMGAAEHMTRALGVDGNRVIDGIGHLGCQKTAPDQLVQPVLVLVQAVSYPLRIQLHVSGTNGFVGILCRGLCFESMELTIIIGCPVAILDELGCCSHGFIGKPQRVGTHVGNQTQSTLTGHVHAFIQLLGNGHGALGSEAQLSGGLLLQGRSGKGRRSGTLLFCLLYVGNGKILAGHIVDDGLSLFLIFQFPLLLLAPVTGGEAARFTQKIQLGIQRPVFLGNKCPDLIFPVHNQTGGNGLNTAGRQAATDLLPQQRGQLVTHNSVQNTTGLLGIYQIIIDVPGGLNGLPNHFLGNFIKGNPLGLAVRQVQQFFQMPGDGFALPVRVSCQIDSLGRSGCCFQFLNQVFLALDGDISGGKITLQIHTHGGLGKIPQMAHTCLHRIVRTQIFSDGFCFGGGLHNHQIRRFAHECSPFLSVSRD